MKDAALVASAQPDGRPVLPRLFAAIVAALLLWPAAAPAQEPPAEQPAAVDVEDLERLVQTLQDDAERQALVDDLQALIAAQRAGAAAEDEASLDGLSAELEARWAVVQERLASPEGLVWVLRTVLLSAVIVLLALIVGRALRRLLDAAMTLSDEKREKYPRLETRLRRYRPVALAAIRILVAVAAVSFVLEIWGLQALAWLQQDWGRRVLSAAFSIGMTIAFAIIVWELATLPIERRLRPVDAAGQPVEAPARLRTLLPLLRTVVLVALLAMVALTILSELGVNIGPLLAGAGVVGVAVGFGSQKLVQDVITGAFILFEETIDVGDVVELGGHAGVVERMSLRTLRLRDLRGNVHTIPFSAVDTVVNMSKEFSFYLAEVGVAYREDTDEVTEVLRQVCEEMRADPDWGPNILEPLEVLGLDRFDASAVIIRVRLKTLPLKQWSTGREFNRRIKKRFDALGIEIPFPHQTVYFGEGKDGTAPPMRVRLEGGKEAPQTESDSSDSAESASSTREA